MNTPPPPAGVSAYPLHWPQGRPRTSRHNRKRAKFDTTFAVSRDELFRELKRLGAKFITLSTNVELRQDGIPYANRREPEDVGVAVYFSWKNKQFALACDKWDKIQDNIRAVCKTIDAIRGIERWGSGDMVDAAFEGFKALPPASSTASPGGPPPQSPPRPTDPWADQPWHRVLGVASDALNEDVAAAYRAKALAHHPDRGGNPDVMAAINRAYDQFRKERGL